MPCGATQDWWVMVQKSDRMWSTGEGEVYPTSKEQWLHGCRRAERSYSTFEIRRGGCEEIPLIQGKEQQLCFAGAAVKRYPMPKVRETQVIW